MAGISDDVENLRVNRGDFMNALEEVHPAFGVSEEELLQVIQNGIIRFDKSVDVSSTFFTSSPPTYMNTGTPPHRRTLCRTSSLINAYPPCQYSTARSTWIRKNGTGGYYCASISVSFHQVGIT